MFSSSSPEQISSPTLVQAAAGSVDITPPAGIHIHNWAHSAFQVASGVHRPLMAQLVAMEIKGLHLLLISLDLGWWMEKSDEAKFRNTILKMSGLSAEQVIVTLTHTHSGPSLSRADCDRPGGGFDCILS